MKRKVTPFYCKKEWDFKKNGGTYKKDRLGIAKKFLDKYGFVVIEDILSWKDNLNARKLLSEDLTNICSEFNNRAVGDINITEDILPDTQGGFRNGYGIAFGKYAMYCRQIKAIRKIFANFHNSKEEDMCISWDNIFYNQNNGNTNNNFWLHFDKMKLGYDNKKLHSWDEYMLQSALYLTDSNFFTPSFVCIPKSHKKLWELYSNTYYSSGHFYRIEDTPEYRDQCVRIHIKKGSIIIWNSQLAHANNCIINGSNKDNNEPKRLGSFLCMCNKKKRTFDAFRNMILLYIKVFCSTHWPNLMMYHGNNLSTKKKYNFNKLCPELNNDISEKDFTKIIDELSVQNLKTQNISLNNIHTIDIKYLIKVNPYLLYKLLPKNIQQIQPIYPNKLM